MKRLLRGTALGLFLGTAVVNVWADDPPRKDDPPAKKDDAAQTPAEKFAAARKAQTEANNNFNKIIAEIQKKGERPSLQNKELNDAFQARNKATQAVVKAAEEVAKADPKSDTGLDAMIIVINNAGPSPAVMKLIAEHHVNNAKIVPILDRLAYGMLNKDLEDFLNKVMEKNTNKDAQGKAAFALANLFMRSRQADAEKLFEKIMTDYKDVKTFNSTLGARAEGALFELKNLQVGKVVPDIEGEDVDGKKFKLSDYRGKVVMLDFWGHW